MWIFTRGNSCATASATAFTKRIIVPAPLPSASSMARQARHWQALYQSFIATEKMS